MIKQLLLLVFLFSSLNFQTCAETKLHITTGFTTPVSDFYKNVLAEADKRMAGISITFEALPAERSLILVNQGVNDAECCRIPAVVGEYKNLVPINKSFFSARFSAFEKKHHGPIKSFADLKPYAVGTVEGWKIAVQKLKEIQPAELHIVTTPEQMFRMINQDRLDYGIVGYLSGLKSISTLKIKSITPIYPPLIEKPLYLMLNSKHKNLIPDFDNVITEMKDDGTISRLYNELIKSIK